VKRRARIPSRGAPKSGQSALTCENTSCKCPRCEKGPAPGEEGRSRQVAGTGGAVSPWLPCRAWAILNDRLELLLLRNPSKSGKSVLTRAPPRGKDSDVRRGRLWGQPVRRSDDVLRRGRVVLRRASGTRSSHRTVPRCFSTQRICSEMWYLQSLKSAISASDFASGRHRPTLQEQED
jgi:hypothetical protein